MGRRHGVDMKSYSRSVLQHSRDADKIYGLIAMYSQGVAFRKLMQDHGPKKPHFGLGCGGTFGRKKESETRDDYGERTPSVLD
jgi:hypothetical protein